RPPTSTLFPYTTLFRSSIVKRLASEGAHVALTYSSSPYRAAAVVKEAQALGVKAVAIQANSTDAGAVVVAVERTVTEFGGIDIRSEEHTSELQSPCNLV